MISVGLPSGAKMDNDGDGCHAAIRRLKQRWDAEDAECDRLERRRKEIFLEGNASETFAPIEDFLTRLDKMLNAVGASVEIDAVWEHLGDQKLRRCARVRSTQPPQQLLLVFTVQGHRIFYHDRSYQFSQDTEALILVITREVERCLKPR